MMIAIYSRVAREIVALIIYEHTWNFLTTLVILGKEKYWRRTSCAMISDCYNLSHIWRRTWTITSTHSWISIKLCLQSLHEIDILMEKILLEMVCKCWHNIKQLRNSITMIYFLSNFDNGMKRSWHILQNTMGRNKGIAIQLIITWI